MTQINPNGANLASLKQVFGCFFSSFLRPVIFSHKPYENLTESAKNTKVFGGRNRVYHPQIYKMAQIIQIFLPRNTRKNRVAGQIPNPKS